MRDPFEVLEEDARVLANHNNRYLHAVRQNVDSLAARLEEREQADTVHLWQPATDVPAEMDVIVGVGDGLDEKFSYLGCYYALQFLRMSLGCVDSLRLGLVSPIDRTAVEREFMLSTGMSFRTLSGSYMRKLLELLLEGLETPRFAIIGVGTKADLEDIDVGVIDDGGPGRDHLNDAIAKMNAEMLRYATSLHFHISEHVGERGYTAAVPEYRAMLDGAVHDFVIISEMLGGALILGDAELFHDFQTSVVSRYFYRPGEDAKWHVGYLRGMLGEIRSLIGRPLSRDRIYPKDDGLRLIKGVLSVLKTIHGVGDVNAWRIIDTLQRKVPEHAPTLDSLERALSFLEVFRYIYQLVVAQEEEIYLDDDVMVANLDCVAEILGYRQVGTISPGTHLLVDYYEHIENVRRDVAALTPSCTDHLKRTTVFADMFDPSYPGNVAADFAERSAFFRGTTFWRDILEMLEQDDGRLLKRYMTDLDSLSPRARKRVVGALTDCADYALGTVMAFIVLLARNRGCDGCDRLCDELSLLFREKLRDVPYAAQKLTELFYRRPRLVNRYLLTAGTEATEELAELLETEVWDPEELLWRDRLERLVCAHSRASRYFRRFIERAGERYPACLTLLDNPAALKDMARGVYAGIEGEADPTAKKKLLGDFYDLEFLRIGLGTISGARAAQTDSEFTEVADTYIKTLFDVCKREVDQAVHFRVATHDLLAIYATGGLGREQAYDDDFDLMILLNTNHEAVRTYAGKIVAKMNAEIIKRGTLPHYRFAEHFGHYVTTLSELEGFLADERPDGFVDKSQILEARMLVGTRRFEEEFRRRLVKPYVFDRRAEYVSSMRREIESRHKDAVTRGMGSRNVKDGVGGLRDILMLLLMYKAVCELREPVNSELLVAAARRDRSHRTEFVFLSGALEFLKNLRSAYRLAVGAEDSLRPEHFHLVTDAMNLDYGDDEEAARRLLMAYDGCTTQVAEVVIALAADLEASLSCGDDVEAAADAASG